MTPAALVAALPQKAARYLSRYIDPAAAFLAYHDGLTVGQAHSRARNAARPLGTSWPDRLPAGALCDHDELLESQQSCGLYGADPREIVEVCEAVKARLEAADAPQKLLQADRRDVDTAALALAFHVSQRRAQQIVKKAREQGGEQGDLFGGSAT